MTDPADDTPKLADLNVRTVRRENDNVDEAMAELEDQLDDLETEVAEKDATIDTLEDEKEQAQTLLAKFEEGQRKEQLDRIREANEKVDADDEVDLSTLEDANVDTLSSVADMVERAAEAATTEGVSNTDDEPDLGGVDPNDDDTDAALAEAASAMGLSKSYEKLQNDEFNGPDGIGHRGDGNEQVDASDLLEELAGATGGGS